MFKQMKLIDGKKLAEEIKDKIVLEINEFIRSDFMGARRPNLAIVLIGGREDSRLYVDIKEREAEKVGIDTHIYRCDAGTKEEDVVNMLKYLSNDKKIDAILVQLPLPENFDTDKIISTIIPEKDVDRFHPKNQKKLLATCNHAEVLPPLYSVVLEMLASIDFELKDKQTCLLVNSDIFGNGLKKVLKCKEAHVDIAKIEDADLFKKIKRADLLISAIGKSEFVKGEMIKKDAVLIDIGINKDGKKVKGDVDQESVEGIASYLSPVPGGVGPMTVAMLFRNTLEIFKRNQNN